MAFEESYEKDLLELELELVKLLSQFRMHLKILRSYQRTPSLTWKYIDEIMPFLSSTLKMLWAAHEYILNPALRSLERHLYGEDLRSVGVGSSKSGALTHNISTYKDNPTVESFFLTVAASSVQKISDGNRQSSPSSLNLLAAAAPPFVAPILDPQAVGGSYQAIRNYDQAYTESLQAHSSSVSQVSIEELITGLGSAELHAPEKQPQIASPSLQAQSDNQSLSASARQGFALATAYHSEDASQAKEDRKRANSHRCDVCYKTFTRGTTLREHTKTHTNERPYKCGTCNKGFSRLKDCRRHELLHTPHREVSCAGNWNDEEVFWGCGRTFTTMDALRAHLKSGRGRVCLNVAFEHDNDSLKRISLGYFVCGGRLENKSWGCFAKFDTMNDLKEHLEAHYDECFEGLCVPEEQRLMDLVVEAVNFPFTCHKIYGGCGSRFESAVGFKAHVDAPFQSHCKRSKIISNAMVEITGVSIRRKLMGYRDKGFTIGGVPIII